MIEPGQTWSLGDSEGGETIAYVLRLIDSEAVEVIVLSSTIDGCQPGTTEEFSASWFHESGSLLP